MRQMYPMRTFGVKPNVRHTYNCMMGRPNLPRGHGWTCLDLQCLAWLPRRGYPDQARLREPAPFRFSTEEAVSAGRLGVSGIQRRASSWLSRMANRIGGKIISALTTGADRLPVLSARL